VGQEGKDVAWVPTPETMVQKMLDLGERDCKVSEVNGRLVLYQ
jgi:hypothetical protein